MTRGSTSLNYQRRFMSRNSFIVRVYDTSLVEGSKNEFVPMLGTVEDVNSGIKRAFHDKEELWVFIAERQQELTEKSET